MHEVSVIEELVESVQLEIKPYPERKVKSVSVTMGKMRQFVPEMMRFCYDVASQGTRLEGSQLLLKEIPICIVCRKCAERVEVTEYDFICPKCGSVDVNMVSGNELVLDSIELSDN